MAPNGSALEARADIEPLDALQQKRREIVKEYAPLEALFGGGNTRLFDAKRKAYRAVIELKVQVNPADYGLAAGKAPTEAAIERAACAAPAYAEYLLKGEEAMVRYLNLKNELAEIEERIESRIVELRAYSAETFLGAGGR